MPKLATRIVIEITANIGNQFNLNLIFETLQEINVARPIATNIKSGKRYVFETVLVEKKQIKIKNREISK
jgi:hypothetical protein